MVVFLDRHFLTTMTDEKRRMNSYAEDPEDRGFLLRIFPARGHQSCWDREAGLGCTLVPEYVEVAYSMHGEEV